MYLKSLRIFLLFFLIAILPAQQEFVYSYQLAGSLSNTTQTITLQLPTNSPATVRLVGISVYCSVDCTGSLKRDGTLATTTLVTPSMSEINGQGPLTAVNVYTNSNVGAGTLIKDYTVSLGHEITIDMTNKSIRPGGNVTYVFNQMSGNYRFFALWKQY